MELAPGKGCVRFSSRFPVKRIESVGGIDHEYNFSTYLFKEPPHCKDSCLTGLFLTGTQLYAPNNVINVLLCDLDNSLGDEAPTPTPIGLIPELNPGP